MKSATFVELKYFIYFAFPFFAIFLLNLSSFETFLIFSDKSLKLLGDSIESKLNELLKLDPQELKITKQNKYLKIT